MDPTTIEYAVDKMAKDLDWLIKSGLKAQRIDTESLSKSELSALRNRFLRQLPEFNPYPPASPLGTSISIGSHKSDEELSVYGDAGQSENGLERLAVSSPIEDIGDSGGLCLKVPTKEEWVPFCYRIDGTVLEGRINADMMEEHGLDHEAKGKYIDVCVRFNNSKDEQSCRMRIHPSIEFMKDSNCNIIFGSHNVESWRASKKGLLGLGDVQMTLEHRSHLPIPGKYEDQTNPFEPDRLPVIQHEKGYGSDISREEAIRLANDAVKNRGGTPLEQAAFTAELLRALLLPPSQHPQGYQPEPSDFHQRSKDHPRAGIKKGEARRSV